MENGNYLDIIKKEYLKSSSNLFRFGSINDGGYNINPNKVRNTDVLFSGGVSSNVEFEYDMFRFNENMFLILVDPTVSKTKLLAKAIFRFFLLKKNKLRYLFNTLIFIYMLRSGRVKHIANWLSDKFGIIDTLKSIGINYDDKRFLLKLDIEGSEYDLLPEILSNLYLFDCMIFEFHELDKKNHLLLDFLKNCSSEFSLVHLEINPSGGYHKGVPKNIEITLERN